MSHWLLLVVLLPFAAGAAPSLSEAQRTQLGSAVDGSTRLDEGAWYPLLENAAQWAPGDEATAAVPDYPAILAEPESHRGSMFLVEGSLARSRPVPLARSGPWGDRVVEWVVVLPPRAGVDDVAVVYLVDPAGVLASPPVGTRVRVAARFYKLWLDRDVTDQPTTYMTFVGRAPADVEPTTRTSRTWLAAPAIAALLAAWFLVRRAIGRRRGDAARLRTAGRWRGQEADNHSEFAAGDRLPEDPAEALDALRRRHTARDHDSPSIDGPG